MKKWDYVCVYVLITKPIIPKSTRLKYFKIPCFVLVMIFWTLSLHFILFGVFEICLQWKNNRSGTEKNCICKSNRTAKWRACISENSSSKCNQEGQEVSPVLGSSVSRASLPSLAENIHCCWQPSPVRNQLSNINKDTIYQHVLQLSAHDIIFKIKFKCFSNKHCSFKVCLYQTHQFYLKLNKFCGKLLDIKSSFVS